MRVYKGYYNQNIIKLIYPYANDSSKVENMGDKKTESEIAQEIRELMQRRSITDTKGYLTYLKEQKGTKRKKSEARMKEAELELIVIEKMEKGEL